MSFDIWAFRGSIYFDVHRGRIKMYTESVESIEGRD